MAGRAMAALCLLLLAGCSSQPKAPAARKALGTDCYQQFGAYSFGLAGSVRFCLGPYRDLVLKGEKTDIVLPGAMPTLQFQQATDDELLSVTEPLDEFPSISGWRFGEYETMVVVRAQMAQAGAGVPVLLISLGKGFEEILRQHYAIGVENGEPKLLYTAFDPPGVVHSALLPGPGNNAYYLYGQSAEQPEEQDVMHVQRLTWNRKTQTLQATDIVLPAVKIGPYSTLEEAQLARKSQVCLARYFLRKNPGVGYFLLAPASSAEVAEKGLRSARDCSSSLPASLARTNFR